MGVVIDANLLCLLVVGATGPAAIHSHARLRAFGFDDYANLLDIFDRVGQPVLCPQVLAETSNLVSYRQAPRQIAIFRQSLARFVELFDEMTIEARRVIADVSFETLGITDAVLLLLSAERKYRLLSDDLQLCLAAERRGVSALNYNYVRDGAVRVRDL